MLSKMPYPYYGPLGYPQRERVFASPVPPVTSTSGFNISPMAL